MGAESVKSDYTSWKLAGKIRDHRSQESVSVAALGKWGPWKHFFRRFIYLKGRAADGGGGREEGSGGGERFFHLLVHAPKWLATAAGGPG